MTTQWLHPRKYTSHLSYQISTATSTAPTLKSADRKGAALVISHRIFGVKEQKSATHFRLPARQLRLPRRLPRRKAPAIPTASKTPSASLNVNELGILSICVLGVYASYAAQSDRPSHPGACVGRMKRNGGLHKENSREYLQATLSLLLLKTAG